MRALEKRILALETARADGSEKCGYFDFKPVMTEEEWNAVAPAQQAAAAQEWVRVVDSPLVPPKF